MLINPNALVFNWIDLQAPYVTLFSTSGHLNWEGSSVWVSRTSPKLVKTVHLIVILPWNSKLLLLPWFMNSDPDNFLNLQPRTLCKIVPFQLFLIKFSSTFYLHFAEFIACQISFFHFSFWYHFLPTPLKTSLFIIWMVSLSHRLSLFPPTTTSGPSVMQTNGFYSYSSSQTASGMLLH